MIAGLPGAGIGGLYYLCLVLLMPIREAWWTIRGRSSRARWGIVARHMTMAGAIVGSIYLVAWGVQKTFRTLADHGLMSAASVRAVEHSVGVSSTVAFLVSVAILTGILLGSFLFAQWRRFRMRTVSRKLPS